jgi:hypothetical protein
MASWEDSAAMLPRYPNPLSKVSWGPQRGQKLERLAGLGRAIGPR